MMNILGAQPVLGLAHGGSHHVEHSFFGKALEIAVDGGQPYRSLIEPKPLVEVLSGKEDTSPFQCFEDGSALDRSSLHRRTLLKMVINSKLKYWPARGVDDGQNLWETLQLLLGNPNLD